MEDSTQENYSFSPNLCTDLMKFLSNPTKGFIDINRPIVTFMERHRTNMILIKNNKVGRLTLRDGKVHSEATVI